MTDRMRRVMAVWNWLPAVRVVAEYESIQRAARALAVSPSALSRTIKLAEEAIGGPLFVRSASSIALTDAGTQMLAAVRTAMRVVDDGLESLVPLPTGRFVVAYVGSIAERLLARVAASLLAAEAPSARRIVMRRIAPDEIEGELLRGQVDLVLADEPVSAAELETSHLGELKFGIFLPPGSSTSDVLATTVCLLGGEIGAFCADGLDGVEGAAAATGAYAELPLAVAGARFTWHAGSPRTASLHAIRRRGLDDRTTFGQLLSESVARELAAASGPATQP